MLDKWIACWPDMLEAWSSTLNIKFQLGKISNDKRSGPVMPRSSYPTYLPNTLFVHAVYLRRVTRAENKTRRYRLV